MMRVKLMLVVLTTCVCACTYADCPDGDLNHDCKVDAADLQILAESWLGDPNSPADLNHDKHVNQADLAIVAAAWGESGCPIVINEVLTHAHGTAPDWIELYNTSALPVSIGGWTFSDRKSNLGKFRIATDTILGPFEYIVFYENVHFGNPLNPDTRVPFALSENGDTLYLYSGSDTTYPEYLVEAVFSPAETWYSFGWYRRSTGVCSYVTMSEMTPGSRNAYPRVGPVIINELMYHPASNADAEYVELFNISDGPVTLFDFTMMEPWRFRDSSGIDFRFPTDDPVTLEKGEYLLLVKDAAVIHQRYTIPSGVKMLPWGSGKLANGGEHLYLLKPGDVDVAGTRYWIEVDSVDYSDGNHPDRFLKKIDPWPVDADGHGPSLDRLFPRKFGDDPNNWQATIPTPGSAND